MHNYRGTSWKRETTHPFPYTGFVMPFAPNNASLVQDRTVHHGFRIARPCTGQDER
jgi:hypothetical protein